jgi:hypothetical protein
MYTRDFMYPSGSSPKAKDLAISLAKELGHLSQSNGRESVD